MTQNIDASFKKAARASLPKLWYTDALDAMRDNAPGAVRYAVQSEHTLNAVFRDLDWLFNPTLDTTAYARWQVAGIICDNLATVIAEQAGKSLQAVPKSLRSYAIKPQNFADYVTRSFQAIEDAVGADVQHGSMIRALRAAYDPSVQAISTSAPEPVL